MGYIICRHCIEHGHPQSKCEEFSHITEGAKACGTSPHTSPPQKYHRPPVAFWKQVLVSTKGNPRNNFRCNVWPIRTRFRGIKKREEEVSFASHKEKSRGTNVGSSLPLFLRSFLPISLRTPGFQVRGARSFSVLTTRISSRNKISPFTPVARHSSAYRFKGIFTLESLFLVVQ